MPSEPRPVFHPLKAIIFLFLVATCVSGAEWRTTDGNISVAAPDASRFVQVDSVPPLSVIWVSKDETVKLGVVEMPSRPDMELIQSSVEKGLANEMRGKIVASSAEKQEGHHVFLMTGHGEILGKEAYMTQAVVAVGNKVYKVMAAGFGKDTRVDPDATEFVSSFKVLTPKRVVNSDPPEDVRDSQPAPNDSSESLVDLLSQRIGGISALILIVCVIVIVLSRSTKRRKPNGDASA